MKPAEIVLRRGGIRENDGRDKSNIYCKHICKYRNVPPIQLLHINKIFKKEKYDTCVKHPRVEF
jgi:hypothetical protein